MRTDKIYITAPTGCFFGENAPLRSRRGAIPNPQRRIAQTAVQIQIRIEDCSKHTCKSKSATQNPANTTANPNPQCRIQKTPLRPLVGADFAAAHLSRLRHCERSEAIRKTKTLDCFVTSFLAMTVSVYRCECSARYEAESGKDGQRISSLRACEAIRKFNYSIIHNS